MSSSYWRNSNCREISDDGCRTSHCGELNGLLIGREPEVKIQNVVATGALGQNLDLYSVLKVSARAEYNPQRFPGLVYRLKRPKTSSLLFSSGKMVCTGAKSERSAKAAIARVANELRTHGIVILRNPEVEIDNIVATADLNGTLDLEEVAERLTKTMYEPEQFPGLIYRMDEPKTVILIFTSGKLVITGAKTEVGVRLAVKKLQETLEKNGLISYIKLASLRDTISPPTIVPVKQTQS